MTNEEWANVKEAVGKCVTNDYRDNKPLLFRFKAWDLLCDANKPEQNKQRDDARQWLVEWAKKNGYIQRP